MARTESVAFGRRDFVGVIPAAGLGSRLLPFRYAKELLPVAYAIDERRKESTPIPVIGMSLRALAAAGVERCIVTTTSRKPEIARCLGSGDDYGVRLAYVCQDDATGLARAVDLACQWIGGAYCCLLLPDTLIEPPTALRTLVESISRERLDLVLGVFPTSKPQELGPVRCGPDGRVQEVLDKPASATLYNTWGMAVWSPAFSELLRSCAREDGPEEPLGRIFDRAVREGMNVKGVTFHDGSFIDVGTAAGLYALMAALPDEEKQALTGR